MNNLTLQIIFDKYSKNIKYYIDLSKKLKCNIQIGSINNKITEKNLYYYNEYNKSKIRNDLSKKIKTKWILFLDDDEFINDKNIENIKNIINNKSNFLYYRFLVINNNIINKKIKLIMNNKNYFWQGIINEEIIYKNKKSITETNINIEKTSKLNKDKINFYINLLNNNIDNDINSYYQLSILYNIIDKNIKSIKNAEKFLFLSNNINKKRYINILLSWIYIYKIHNFNKANNILFKEIAQKPNIPELWCLLGDLYYKIKDYKNSKKYYQNAIISSKYIDKNNLFLDIEKHYNYPNKQIKKCENINNNLLNKPIIP